MEIEIAQINPIIGDVEGNSKKVLAVLERSSMEIVLFPEMTLTGYPPEDLLFDEALVRAAEAKLKIIAPKTKGRFVAVGLPRKGEKGNVKRLYNSAAVFASGKLLGFHDKMLLPTYDVFDELRFFEPGKRVSVWKYKGKKIAVTICEDLWQHAHVLTDSNYSVDPVLLFKKQRPDLVLNLSASPYYYGKKRIAVFQAAAKTLKCPVVVCNQVGANDQLIFDGSSFCLNGKGQLVQLAKSFEEDVCVFDTAHKPRAAPKPEVQDLFNALVLGVRDYFYKQGFRKAVLGLSGGVDSAVVACIAARALGKENVLALALPTRYSSAQSFADAETLAHNLGIELKKIEIDALFQGYLDLLPFSPIQIAEENLQSRIRGMILMAFSNQTGALLLNTGNKSEFAMGYTTLYGDMCGGLGVLLDVVKIDVYRLARLCKEIPHSILERPPTAELRYQQTDQDTLPPYDVLDSDIQTYIEKRGSISRDIAHRIHLAEYKRRQAPIGLRVSSKCFSKGRNVPIVQKWR